MLVGGWSPGERRAIGKKIEIVRSSITQSASQSVKVDFHCRVIFTCSEVVAILVYRTKHERIKFFLYVPLFIFLLLQTNIGADHENEKGYYKLKVICLLI